jgi:hypothetical protein
MVWPVGNSITAAPDLSHRALINVFERFGRFAIGQTLDRFANVIASLERSGTKAGQWFACLAVDHRSDVANGKDAWMIFHLKIGADRNPTTMSELHAKGLDDRIGFQPSCSYQCVCLHRLPVRELDTRSPDLSHTSASVHFHATFFERFACVVSELGLEGPEQMRRVLVQSTCAVSTGKFG